MQGGNRADGSGVAQQGGDVFVSKCLLQVKVEAAHFREQAADEGIARAGGVQRLHFVSIDRAALAAGVVPRRALCATGVDDVLDRATVQLPDAARRVAFAGDKFQFIVGNLDDVRQRQIFLHGGMEVGGIFPQRQTQVDVKANQRACRAEALDGNAVRLTHRAGGERHRAIVEDVARLRRNRGEVVGGVEHIGGRVAVEGKLALAVVMQGNEGQRRFRIAAALQVTGIDTRRLRGGGNLLAESILADLAQNVTFAAEAGISGGNVERRAADRRGVADVGVGLARAAGDEVNQGFADGVEGHDVLRWWINARWV